jgi:hypothetical protein
LTRRLTSSLSIIAAEAELADRLKKLQKNVKMVKDDIKIFKRLKRRVQGKLGWPKIPSAVRDLGGDLEMAVA